MWGWGGVGTLIFAYIRRLGSFFGFKILNVNWVFKKINILWWYEDFVDVF